MLPVKRAIMILLSLLVGLFLLGSWLIASLNLEFAENAMGKLRERQITDTFYANLDRINAHHRLMEQSTRGLARAGGLLLRTPADPATLSNTLRNALLDFPDSYGSSLWYVEGGRPARYAYRQGQRIQVEPLNADEEQRLGSWFQRLRDLPDPGDPAQQWSAAYYKSSINGVVISHATLIRDAAGQPAGLAMTDWLADDIIRTVSRVEVTPSTFAFLLDHDNRNLSSLSDASDVDHAQQLIDSITALELHDKLQEQPLPVIDSRQLASPMQQLQHRVEQQTYSLFFSPTRAGMIFGIGVPQAEIDAVLTPMRESSTRIQLLAGTVMLVISALILYLVAGTLRQLHNLYTDTLTHLPNRERLLADLKKTHTASLLLLNLDAFKEINDFYGHRCGDHVIGTLAEALQQHLNERADWRGSRLYRMPADELAIWLPGHHSHEQLTPALTRLLGFISNLDIQWQEQDIPLNASIGVACCNQRGAQDLTGEQLLPAANIALELARADNESFVFYDASQGIREGYEQNLIGANRLRAALEEDRIVAFFQPIMDVQSQQIEKYECLVRMIDEQGEPVSPIHFLDLAKKVRLYRAITRCMIDSAIERFADQRCSFSINLSCEDLLDPDLADYIISTVEAHAIGERAIFEILESEGIENYAAVRQFIDRAKSLGCRIAIDDFGTGYSNFEHLMRLNVDLIKIDGSLIRQLDENPTAVTLCRGIVQFADELGMQTVAEFVHSPAVLSRVQELGIHFAQGAAIGMPSASLITEVRLTNTGTQGTAS
ncbi:MAG: EAL domain-containing protein [Pseudomonadaceae bacterium]